MTEDARNAGADPRGAGMASSLANTWVLGPPARRRRAEIPGLIGINSRVEFPESGETDFPGAPRAIGRHAQLPGKLEIGRESPRELPVKFGRGWRISLPPMLLRSAARSTGVPRNHRQITEDRQYQLYPNPRRGRNLGEIPIDAVNSSKTRLLRATRVGIPAS